MAVLGTMEAVTVSLQGSVAFFYFILPMTLPIFFNARLLCPSSEILTSSCLLPDVPGAVCLDLNSHCCSLSCWCHNVFINGAYCQHLAHNPEGVSELGSSWYPIT